MRRKRIELQIPYLYRLMIFKFSVFIEKTLLGIVDHIHGIIHFIDVCGISG